MTVPAAPPAPVTVTPSVPLPPSTTEAAIPPPPTTAEPEIPVNFAQLMPHITAALRDKRLDMQTIINACTSVGVPALPALAGQPALVPLVFNILFGASDE